MAKTIVWQRVTDVKAFLAGGYRDVGVHSPKAIKRLPWPRCSRCGLLYLKNAATARAIKQACVTIKDEP